MDWALLYPLIVDVIAQFLDTFWNFKSSWWLVLALSNLDSRWSPIASVSRYPIESRTMKMKEMRRTQFEGPLRLQKGFYHVRNGPKLLNCVECFFACKLIGIGDDLRI